MPFYAQHGLAVEVVLTDNGREFCGTNAHPNELYLELQSIEPRRTPGDTADQRFCRTFHPHRQGGIFHGRLKTQGLHYHW